MKEKKFLSESFSVKPDKEKKLKKQKNHVKFLI